MWQNNGKTWRNVKKYNECRTERSLNGWMDMWTWCETCFGLHTLNTIEHLWENIRTLTEGSSTGRVVVIPPVSETWIIHARAYWSSSGSSWWPNTKTLHVFSLFCHFYLLSSSSAAWSAGLSKIMQMLQMNVLIMNRCLLQTCYL